MLAEIDKYSLEPFLLQIQSDHRGQYIDINKNMLLTSTDKIPPRHLCKLNAAHPQLNNKYINRLHSKLTEDNIIKKALQLNQSIAADHLTAESINIQFIRLCKFAEKSLPNPSLTPWSKELNISCITTKIVEYHITQLKTCIDMTKPIKNLQQQLKFDDQVPDTVTETQMLIKQLKKQLKDNIKKAEKLRIQHIENRLTSSIMKLNNFREAIIQRIKKQKN